MRMAALLLTVLAAASHAPGGGGSAATGEAAGPRGGGVCGAGLGPVGLARQIVLTSLTDLHTVEDGPDRLAPVADLFSA